MIALLEGLFEMPLKAFPHPHAHADAHAQAGRGGVATKIIQVVRFDARKKKTQLTTRHETTNDRHVIGHQGTTMRHGHGLLRAGRRAQETPLEHAPSTEPTNQPTVSKLTKRANRTWGSQPRGRIGQGGSVVGAQEPPRRECGRHRSGAYLRG